MAQDLKPGDRVEHSDGKIGTVAGVDKVSNLVTVYWDDKFRTTTSPKFLHLIRSTK